MITYKQWKHSDGAKRIYKDGWFLLGIIPLYIRWLTHEGEA